MAEYSVLALLGQAGRKGMRMSELAQRRLMSAGGFTRLADRLEQRGLIERRRSPGDGRGFEAVLTSDGRASCARHGAGDTATCAGSSSTGSMTSTCATLPKSGHCARRTTTVC
ncbi:MarR family transcriptional regulator [Streptomyces spiralis]|uniref:MarR family transcriptional regulator n=1 Tax=Streptomyces spiralis TaxID=66376 RepID=UPI0036A99FF5